MKRQWLQLGRCVLGVLGAMGFLVACSDDEDSVQVPGLMSDMVEVYCDDQGYAYKMCTDGDVEYVLSRKLSSGIPLATLRCMVTYAVEGNTATLYNSIQRVTVLRDSTLAVGAGSDAVSVTSMWMAQNHRYLNLRLSVRGKDVAHSYGYRVDSVAQNGVGTHTHYLSLYHDKNGDPDYYDLTQYASVQLSQVADLQKGDSLFMTVNTPEGIFRRGYVY